MIGVGRAERDKGVQAETQVMGAEGIIGRGDGRRQKKPTIDLFLFSDFSWIKCSKVELENHPGWPRSIPPL